MISHWLFEKDVILYNTNYFLFYVFDDRLMLDFNLTDIYADDMSTQYFCLTRIVIMILFKLLIVGGY